MVSVKRVMELETFADSAELIGGRGGIERVITYITVSETPDFYEWVSGGEFVLTTLYAFKDNKERQLLNYTELAKRGVAALGIKVQRFVENIPQELIEIADQYQMPLFAIKRKTKFREIIQAVSAEVSGMQTNMLIEVEGHYNELTKAALVCGDFNEYVKGFGRRKGCGVYCFSHELKLLGSYQRTVRIWREKDIRTKLEQHLSNYGEFFRLNIDAGMMVFPCVARGQVLGYLVIDDSGALSETHTLMANQLTTFLTMKLIDQQEIEQKMLIALLDDILYKHNLSEEQLRERLILHGLKADHSYQVIVIRPKTDVVSTAVELLMRRYASKLQHVLDNALRIAKVNEVVILTASKAADVANPPWWVKHLGSEVLAHDCPIIIGIGPAVTNAAAVASSYQIAKSTVKAGRAFDQGGILYYRHFLARILLLQSTGTPEQQYLLVSVIEPLVEQDTRYNTQILPSIAATIFADDLEQAAAQLFVHVNTIRYRLNKIKALTGHDFFTAKGRYVITTAYLVHCYNK